MSEKSPPASLWGRDVLREREELLREAEQIAHIGSWAWDMRTGSVAWSDELYRILGRDPEEEATFERFIECIHPDDRDAVQDLAARAASGDVAERAEYRVLRRDGTIREIAGLAQIFRDGDGVPRRMVGVAMDVTEVRKLENDLHHAQKMEALGRIAGGIAHDFNNLLTVILLNGAALKRAAPSRELQQIIEAATSASGLTTQLLAFSRRSPRAPRALDANQVVAQSLEMLERLIGDEIRVTFEPSGDVATIVADEAQMHQVLLNLALNARDAMPEGGDLSLRVERAELARGSFVRLSVRDSGMGMDDGTRARLFEPFFTTKEPGKGTGLGLAIVFGIVSQSGGFLEVDSAPGQGSTFHVLLPHANAQVSAKPRSSSPSRAPAGELVLLVEDSDDVRAVLERFLRYAGYEVVSSERPSHALTSWETIGDRVAVLVSDLVMPDMSGRDLAQRLRARRADLPVVFLTGYDPDPRELEGDRMWCLTKPVTEERFLETVREAVKV